MRNPFFIATLLLYASTAFSQAESINPSTEQIQKCMQTSVVRADESLTISALTKACSLLLQQGIIHEANDNPTVNGANTESTTLQTQVQTKDALTSEKISQIENIQVPIAETKKSTTEAPQQHLFKDRLTMEALNRSNRFILIPNKRNFLLPVTYSKKPNNEPYNDTDGAPIDLNNIEAEFQLSVKILLRENIFANNGHLYLGYTSHALWQVYDRRLSAPFRETDHQPELILSFTNDWEVLGFHNAVNEVIINHQSNGQTGLLSRSWNRIMFTSVFEKGDFALALTPWYRLPEDLQEYPGDPRGDDNPDISKFMGHFELSGAYQHDSDIFSVQIRNNLHTKNYGAIEVGWTFPVTKTMRGFINYFDGYGRSLIDYNAEQRTLGLGIIFTDLF